MRLSGKVALVVGGTSGTAAAISRRLVTEGATLAVLYRDRSADAGRLVAETVAAGGRAFALAADVADPVRLTTAVDAVLDRYDAIDILVGVAGTADAGGLDDADAFDRLFAVNVRAPFLAARRAAALMPPGGRIIVIGSIVADRAPGAGVALYAASKSALAGLTRGWRVTWAGAASP